MSATRFIPVLLLLLVSLWLGIFLVVPVWALTGKSFFDGQAFVGLFFFEQFLQTPGLTTALRHTLFMGLAVTACTLVPAFILAYSLTHTRFWGRGLCRSLAYLPLFIPSFLPSIGLVYLLGAQGPGNELFGDIPLYGPLGIFLGTLIYTLPHATLPIVAALRNIDADLYAAARTLGAGPIRRFVTVTLPGAGYGLIRSGIVIFVLTITDFGIPKVLGGEYSMLATEVFKQVIGLQNFSMGAVAGIVLLAICLPAFFLDILARKKLTGIQRGRAYNPVPQVQRDTSWGIVSWGIALLPITVIGTVVWGSFISFWPYDLALTFANYSFENTIYGLAPFTNSIMLAFLAALLGVTVVFSGSYLTIRCAQPTALVMAYRSVALVPLALPGMVLGIAYIFAFNTNGILHDFYGSIPLLACNCVIHFYTVCHFTAFSSLTTLPPNYEIAAASLGVGRLRTFFRVIVPLQKHTLMEIFFYLFVNSLTTVSAVVFLYTPASVPASVAILQMLDSGAMAQASAMGVLLMLVAITVSAVFGLISLKLRKN